MARSCWLARRHAHAIWVGNSNRTNGRVCVQNSSLSKLLGWDWNFEKSIATGTRNSEPLDHLERRLTAPAVKREAEEDWNMGVLAQFSLVWCPTCNKTQPMIFDV